MDQSGFSASPWAAMLGHHSIGSNEHPGFVAHAHNAAVVHHHAHHNIPMDLHVAQGFPYYRYVFYTSNTYNFLHLYHLQCKKVSILYYSFQKREKKCFFFHKSVNFNSIDQQKYNFLFHSKNTGDTYVNNGKMNRVPFGKLIRKKQNNKM